MRLNSLVILAAGDQCDVSTAARSDCGFVGVDQGQCEAKGCCWKPTQTEAENGGVEDVPWCYYKAASCPLKYETTGQPYTDAEIGKIRQYFLANLDIQSSGAVIASPDKSVGYYYDWARDGALSMGALLKTSPAGEDVDTHFGNYINWVAARQAEADPHGVDIRVEVKFEVPSGAVYDGGWCRPQTDAPGLRARVLSEYALQKLKGGDKSFVQEKLWTGDDGKYNGGLIKYDLAWVVANWQQNSCDLWEEVQSEDFFWGRYTMRAGLMVGAQLAEAMGDTASAATYRSTASDIEGTLGRHFNGAYVFESDNRPVDSAVVGAFSDGDFDGNQLYAPLSKEVLLTISNLNSVFCNAFPINQQDTAAGTPGVMYGRYPGDTFFGGNPWFLLSAYLGELVYRQAAAAPGATLDADTYAALKEAFGFEDGLSGAALAKALLGAGDGVLLRIRKHTEGSDFHMNEQLGKSDGQMTSAQDLTWGYANLLKALQARQSAAAAAQQDSVLV
mmetsp:Transcript_31922/g.69889  ORF Transcript_31922/g.69889 Transcript_31922/m.69889 type:complete len:502 (+) Transcript_31922:46-1551(+)